MEMWLTKGMFGDRDTLIAEDTADSKKIIEKLFMWKNDGRNRRRYKIEQYDRMIFGKEGVAIDFGDYTWFMLVTGDGFENFSREIKDSCGT